ncbi:MAG: MFS transporter [Planctomycetota bacterium]
MNEDQKTSMSIMDQIRTMKWNFWIANMIEAFERLAYFGVRAVLPLYMFGTQSVLGLTMTEKGVVYGIWAFLQCIVPMVSGGYTDSYGYKKSMFVAFAINILGYSMMAWSTGFWTILPAACFVGIGTAIFKPPVQGSIAKSLNQGNSALGFGIFYWMVNVGGFFAPLLASLVRGNVENPTWNYVFYGAALVTAINFIPAIFLFREPELNPEAMKKKPLQVFKDTMILLWQDKAMLRFLLVISGFWFMFMQLWDLLPNFIDEWVDTRDVSAYLPSLDPLFSWLPGVEPGWSDQFLEVDGRTKPELLINIDSFAILLLVLPLSWFFGRFRMMTALVTGMFIALLGFVGAGLSMIGLFVGGMIFIFAIGEIICSPKFSEYIGMSAPGDKKAIYMGYSNIPYAIGWGLGNLCSGPLYDLLSSKATLARKYLVEQAGMAVDAVAKIAEKDLLGIVAEHARTGDDPMTATAILWDLYHPWVVWVILGIVGLIALLSITITYVKSRRMKTS